MRVPSQLVLNAERDQLRVCFETCEASLSAEFLRVHSPSAEVQGHTPEQAVLQTNKEAVLIEAIEPVGQYAVRLVFDDGHDSGIYSWETLLNFVKHHDTYWQQYLVKLAQSGYTHAKQITELK